MRDVAIAKVRCKGGKFSKNSERDRLMREADPGERAAAVEGVDEAMGAQCDVRQGAAVTRVQEVMEVWCDDDPAEVERCI